MRCEACGTTLNKGFYTCKGCGTKNIPPPSFEDEFPLLYGIWTIVCGLAGLGVASAGMFFFFDWLGVIGLFLVLGLSVFALVKSSKSTKNDY